MTDRSAASSCLPGPRQHPIYADEDVSLDACKRLWQHVVLQALQDASGTSIVRAEEPELLAARAFLLNEHSTWALARELACLNAGMDPAKVRSCFLRLQADSRLQTRGATRYLVDGPNSGRDSPP